MRWMVGLILSVALAGLRAGERKTDSPSASASEFIAQSNAHFAEWDIDKNEALTASELDAAVSSTRVVGPEAAAVSALKRAAADKKLPLTTLSRDNILNVAKSPPPALQG